MTPDQKSLKDYVLANGPSPNPYSNCTLAQATAVSFLLMTLGFIVQHIYVQCAHPQGQPATGRQIDADDIRKLGLSDLPMYYNLNLQHSTAGFEAAATMHLYGQGGSFNARRVFAATNQGLDSGFVGSWEQRILDHPKVHETIEALFPPLSEAA